MILSTEKDNVDTPSWWIPLGVALGTLGLYFLRFGYDFGWSDQDEFIPFLKHLLDPSLYQNDWFVSAQASGFNVRTYFIYGLFLPAKILPIATVFLIGYVISFIAIAWALFRLAWNFSKHAALSAVFVVLVLVFTPQWTLGGNDLVHSMWAPSMVGWSLGLWGVAFFFEGKYLQSAVLIGLAVWMQALVGLQLALVLGLVLVVELVQNWDHPHFKALQSFSIVFLGVSSVALIPLLSSQLQNVSPPPGYDGPSLFYIIGAFRNPHHYLFHSFPVRSLIAFGSLFFLGVLGLSWRKPEAISAQAYSRCRLLVLIIATIGIGAYIGTEAIPILFVAKLQLFKTTVLAKVLLLLAVVTWIYGQFPQPFQWIYSTFLAATQRLLTLVGILWVLLAGSLLLQIQPIFQKARPLARIGSSELEFYSWVRGNTSPNDIFITPPSWSGFRSQAERPVFANFKAFPYRDDLIFQWYERLLLIAPLSPPVRALPSLQSELDEAYARQSLSALQANLSLYEAAFIVRAEEAADIPDSMTLVYRNAYGAIYQLHSTPGRP